MYVPSHFAASLSQIRELLDRPGAADLITPTADGLQATFLPLLHDPDVGPHGALLGHFARNNPHWQQPPTGESLVILRGPDSYVSPSWYASKAEHGRVVPTWNYLTAHVYGELVVHDDVTWLDSLVHRLTDQHEARRPEPGRCPTPRRSSSPGSCARSSGWRCGSPGSRRRRSSARTARRPIARA